MAEQGNSYPMLSEKNWWTIRNKFKASLPAVVSPNYIKTLLTMSSDASAVSNVITPLKRMGLIDDENKPTTLANDWRLDNKYKDVCATIIGQVYPRELLDLFPDVNVDRVPARNWFMGNGVGQGAADKMVALFTLLKDGEIRENKSGSSQKVVSTTKSTAKAAKQTIAQKRNDAHQDGSQEKEHQPAKAGPNLHIDLQIHISPESSPEQIETIFASMAKHLYGADNS